jgi:cyclopropane-fatty-acyl-phospholipid synthase
MQVNEMLEHQALNGLFEQMRGSSFTVTYSDGATEHYGEEGEPQFKVCFRDDVVLDLLRDDPLMNFGEAYMDGRVDMEGDLADLVSLAIRNGLFSATNGTRGLAGAALRAVTGLRSLRREKENIARHYDLGNDFFRLWLDESMTYSCAYFRDASDTLEQAQRQKVEHSLEKLRLQPGERLLDIGCGWGALVMRAAEQYGADATGITLSEEQHVEANATIRSRGLQDKARVRLMDYGALAQEGKQFDKIVSIGMIEHVGKAHLEEFARDVKLLLKPEGLALLHLITGVTAGPVNNWMERYIFPGGYIPTLPQIITHLSAQSLHVCDVEQLGSHYRRTLDEWSERFERVVPAVREKCDERFVRMWRVYLRASSAGFREALVDVHQILVIPMLQLSADGAAAAPPHAITNSRR